MGVSCWCRTIPLTRNAFKLIRKGPSRCMTCLIVRKPCREKACASRAETFCLQRSVRSHVIAFSANVSIIYNLGIRFTIITPQSRSLINIITLHIYSLSMSWLNIKLIISTNPLKLFLDHNTLMLQHTPTCKSIYQLLASPKACSCACCARNHSRSCSARRLMQRETERKL